MSPSLRPPPYLVWEFLFFAVSDGIVESVLWPSAPSPIVLPPALSVSRSLEFVIISSASTLSMFIKGNNAPLYASFFPLSALIKLDPPALLLRLFCLNKEFFQLKYSLKC